jgi:uncharacterized membrane protein HdeD (DUF308 family)
MNVSDTTPSPDLVQPPHPMGKFWWIYLIQGIGTMILGGLLIFWPRPTLTLIVTILGVYWLGIGILHIATAIFNRQAQNRTWLLLSGALGILAGLVVLAQPLVATLLVPTALVLIVGVLGILIGLVGLAQALRGGGWGPAVWGIVSCLFGLILFSNPLIAVGLLTIFLGVMAILGGLALIAIAFRVRK